MRLLVFWTADEDSALFDGMGPIEAFETLYRHREELGARIYDLDAMNYNDSMQQDGIKSMSDFEDDYNNEDLDGGFWSMVLEVGDSFVKRIVKG